MDGNSRLQIGFRPGLCGRGMHKHVHMEIKRRMRTRLAWIVAILVLISIGVLMACNSKYSSNDNGLVVIPSQGGGPLVNNQLNGPVMETFSLDLSNGSTSEINNVNGPPTPGLPTAIVLDPAG